MYYIFFSSICRSSSFFNFSQTPLCCSMVLIMSLELVAVSAAALLTGVVIYVVCFFGFGYEEGDVFYVV